MKIFLDVGSNLGQTVNVIREPRYGFDRIYCFEPVPELQQIIARTYSDSRIIVNDAGLWNQTCEKPVFSPGSQSASIFADKINVDPHHSVMCKFVRASHWFQYHLTEADEVYLKLNCEGSEVDIIEDLLDSNEFRKITSLGVAFDVRKIPSQRGREIELKRRLEESGIRNYVDIELHPGDDLKATIHAWLSMAGAERLSLGTRIRQIVYDCLTFAAQVARYSRRSLTGR
jgi:FkbM family methyltransferase